MKNTRLIFTLLVFTQLFSSQSLFSETRTSISQSKSEKTELVNFSDKNLFDLLNKNLKGGIIYFWSPHMPLSVRGIASMKTAAKKLAVPVLFLVDPLADSKAILAAAKQGQLSTSEIMLAKSRILYNKGLTLHYPTSIFYFNNKLSNRKYPGFKPDTVYQNWISYEKKTMFSENQNASTQASLVAGSDDRFWSWGSTDNRVCEANAFAADQIYDFPHFGYWMKALGDRYITYTSVDGDDGKAFDLKESKRISFSSRLDPFPTPDGKYYVHPEPIQFIKSEDGVEFGDQAERIFVDPDLTGTYQSVAMPLNTKTRKIYRIIVGGANSILLQDYIVDIGLKGEITFSKKYSIPKQICQNINPEGLTVSTPIISNIGDLIAGQDYHTQSTKVYRINVESQLCEPILDLGISTNKIAFSFDDKFITFIAQTDNAQMSNKRLYIFGIKEKTTYLISTPAEIPNYQSFRPDQKLMFTRMLDPSDTGHTPDSSKLIFIDYLKFIEILEKSSLEQQAIGYLWSLKCNSINTSLIEAKTIGARIAKSSCLALLPRPEDFGKARELLPAAFQGLTLKQLLHYCNGLISTN
jgi:hypothetical protein